MLVSKVGITLTLMLPFSFFSSAIVVLLWTTNDLSFNSEERIVLSGIYYIEKEGFIRRTIKTEGDWASCLSAPKDKRFMLPSVFSLRSEFFLDTILVIFY